MGDFFVFENFNIIFRIYVLYVVPTPVSCDGNELINEIK